MNVPNKAKDDPLLESVKDLLDAGVSDVCVHYSIKNQPGRANLRGKAAVADAALRLESVCKSLWEIQHAAERQRSNTDAVVKVSVLLVSGGGKKSVSFNSLTALKSLEQPSSWASAECISNSGSGIGSKRKAGNLTVLAPDLPTPPQLKPSQPVSSQRVPIFVAFNPYLPDGDELDEEYARLEQKLATGIVSGIYLQVIKDEADDVPELSPHKPY